jgi:arginase family enzyme
MPSLASQSPATYHARMSTTAVGFPFDQFGSPGTSAGARLLFDGMREMLADNRREVRPTRARAYDGQVRLREVDFDTMPRLRAWRERGRKAAAAGLDAGFLFWLGGNHLSALPVYEELGQRNAVVVQFDAHLDLYHLGDCTAELSHGNFLRHLDGPRPGVINIGHRDLFLPPADIAEYFLAEHPASQLATDPEGVATRLRDLTAAAPAIYFDLDCDALDPAFFPAVTHPLPFGMTPHQLLRLLEAAWSDRVVGFGISEFDPGRDRADQSLSLLLWLAEHLLLRRYEGHRRGE